MVSETTALTIFTISWGDEMPPPMMIQSDMELLLPYRCSVEERRMLESSFSKEEIKEAFFNLPRNKSSGPDGYSGEFFKACWHVVGYEVTDVVLKFFVNGKLLKQWNATNLVLIPKIPNAS